MLHASSKHSDSHHGIISSSLSSDATLMTMRRFGQDGGGRTMWRQPPPLSREACPKRRRKSETERPRQKILIVFLALALLLIPASVHAASWTLYSQPTRLLNGAPVLFQVKPPETLNSLTGKWEGHDLTFSYDAAARTWFVLAGVSFATVPGKYPLELSGESAKAHSPVRFTRTFTVYRANYPKIKVQLAVEKKFTEPSPEQQTQIAESVKVKQEYLGRVTPDREWNGKFAAPVDAPTSDVYGSQRIFNGVAQREHQGLDYRVPTGTPVAAMNDGTVLLARFLYFEGNCVVIDHGQGLLTLYFHLSEIKVKEGDSVKRGQEIGLSGGTGRATGPHLHVAVRWQGTYLDPSRLLQLKLP
jgi:murein DD-endopeptidase MepM/ murein hydrolase activator NlpD